VSEAIRTEVVRSMRAGERVTRTAERVLDADRLLVSVPEHVEELAQEALNAAPGDPEAARAFAQAVDRWRSRIERLGQAGGSERPVGDYTMRSATEQLVRDLDGATEAQVTRSVNRWILERATHHARIVARTETAAAYRDSYERSLERVDGVIGYRWTLSPRHPRPDVCDVYASQDLFGLGPGGYPADQVPATPHPSCLCSQSAILDRFALQRELAVMRGEPEPPRDWESGRRETGAEWLARQPASFRDSLLGPTRARIFATEPGRVLTPQGAPIPVHQVLGQPPPVRSAGRQVQTAPLVRAERAVRPTPPLGG
jgi:hypothetical protein